MEDIENKDVSDPLKHLLSLDFGLASPLDEISEEFGVISKNKSRHVRFADPPAEFEDENNEPKDNKSVTHELRGILKNKLSFEDSDLGRGYLTTTYSYQDDEYSNDFSEEDDVYDNLDEESNIGANDLLTPILELNEDIAQDEANISDYENDLVNDNVEVDIGVVEEITSPTDEIETWTEISNDFKVIAIPNVVHETETIVCLSSKDSSQRTKLKNPLKVLPSTKLKTTGADTKCVGSHQIYKKPEMHFCLISLNDSMRSHKQHIKDLSQYYSGISMRPGIATSQKSLRNLKFCWLTHQSGKLKQVLFENVPNMSAKDLRLSVFHAWCRLKEREKLLHSETSDLKNSQQDGNIKNKASKSEAQDAFLAWKSKKDSILQKKKKWDVENNSKNKKGKQSDENNLVYNAWKKQKDEYLKMKLEKQRSEAIATKMNSLEAKKMQKEEAKSAFNAWKDMKRKFEHEKKQSNSLKAKEESKQKDEEKVERSKMSEEAYFQWLEQKYIQERKDHDALNKPPWNPPG